MSNERSPIRTNLTLPADTTTQVSGDPQQSDSRDNFFQDLKKVVRKLPPDHPSRSDSRKR